MARYSVRITDAAEQDLLDIIEYIASDNPVAAFRLADAIEQGILKLEDFPQIGVIPKNRRLMKQGYRILILDNYLVFYVVAKNEVVEIRRILSSKRDYAFLF